MKGKQKSKLFRFPFSGRSSHASDLQSLSANSQTTLVDDSSDQLETASLVSSEHSAKKPEKETLSSKPASSESSSSQPSPLSPVSSTKISSATSDLSHQSKKPPSKTFKEKAKDVAGATYEGLKATLKVVERSSDMFLPLKLPAAVLVGIIEIVEAALENKEALRDMEERLTAVVKIIQKYENSTSSAKVTERIKQLAQDITLHIDEIKEMLDHNIVRRMAEGSKDAESISKILRKINFLFSAFQIDTTLSIDVTVDQIAKTVDRMHRNEALGNLCAVPDASHDAQKIDGCMEGTRKSILREIFSWATDSEGPSIFWLNGMAGMGKSAIALSFAHWLQRNHLLGGTFFCSRQGSDRNDVTSIFPTLAYDLAHKFGSYEAALVKSMEQNPNVARFSPAVQFKLLMESPLHSASIKTEDACPLIFIVDAIDECKDGKEIEKFLRVLLEKQPSLKIKFFISSRPEPRIRDELEGSDVAIKTIRLHAVINDDSTKADIELFLKTNFQELRHKKKLAAVSDGEWPGLAQFGILLELTNKLFIYAFTALGFISEPKADPQERLTFLISSQSMDTETFHAQLDEMYRIILESALKGMEKREIENIKRTIAGIVCLRDSLSISDLARFLELSAGNVRMALAGVHSLIRVPEKDEDDVVMAYHTSFMEYVLDPNRTKNAPWLVDSPQTHLSFGRTCLKVLTKELDFNISSTKTSLLSNREQDSHIPSHIKYASRFWVDHLVLSGTIVKFLKKIHRLIDDNFLYWLEVMSVCGRASDASRMLRKLVITFATEMPEDILEFMKDANEFIIGFREAISLSAPHIYISALPFVHSSSQIAKLYCEQFPRTLAVNDHGAPKPPFPTVCVEKHEDKVLSVGFFPGDDRIISTSSDRTIQMWNTTTGEAVSKPLRGHTNDVETCSISPNGSYIASGSLDKTVRLWDVSKASEIHTMTGHTSDVNSVVFSPDGRYVASGSSDRSIKLWNSKTGKLVSEIQEAHPEGIVVTLAFSPNTKGLIQQIASGSEDKTIKIWNIVKGKLNGKAVKHFTGHTTWIGCVAFSPDGQRLLSASMDCTLRIWDIATGQFITLIGHSNVVLSGMFSPDGKLIVSGSSDKTVRIWSAETGTLLSILTGHAGQVRSVAISSDGKRIVSGSIDKTVRVWDVQIGDEMLDSVPQGHASWVKSVIISSDNQSIISSSGDHTIRVWDAVTGKLKGAPLTGHTDEVYTIAFLPGQKKIISASADLTLRIWDLETGKPVGEPFKGHTDFVSSLAVSPKGDRVASGSFDTTVRVWDIETAETIVGPLVGHDEDVQDVSYSWDGRYIASAAQDCTIRIWDAQSGKLLSTLKEDGMERVISVKFSPNQCYNAVSASKDGIVRIWDVENQTVLKQLKGHTDWAKIAVYSSDGRYIASSGRDCTIIVWEAESGERLARPWKGQSGWVNGLAFSQDGQFIVSASSDCTARLWDSELNEAKDVHASSDSATDAISEHPLVFFSPENNSRIPARLRGDGWLVGPQNELLLWIPLQYRCGLWWPTTTAIFGATASDIDLTHFVFGKDWINCMDFL